MKCPECRSGSVSASSIPGLMTCSSCGKLFAGVEAAAADIGDGPLAPEQPSELVIPDSTELAYGWRTWEVRLNPKPNETRLLRSVTHREAYWTAGEAMVATCPKTTGKANGVQRQGHEVPAESCTCGLYSAKTYEHLLSMNYHFYDGERSGWVNAIGRVKLWGKVIEGRQGWRAEKGYPDEIWVPYEAYELIEPLKKAYGCKVGLRNFLGYEYTKTKEA